MGEKRERERGNRGERKQRRERKSKQSEGTIIVGGQREGESKFVRKEERKVQFSIMTFFRVENNLSSESRKGRRRFDRTTTRQRRDVTTTIEGRFFDRNVSNGLNVFLKKTGLFFVYFRLLKTVDKYSIY